jgi:hypothetical protein
MLGHAIETGSERYYPRLNSEREILPERYSKVAKIGCKQVPFLFERAKPSRYRSRIWTAEGRAGSTTTGMMSTQELTSRWSRGLKSCLTKSEKSR